MLKQNGISSYSLCIRPRKTYQIAMIPRFSDRAIQVEDFEWCWDPVRQWEVLPTLVLREVIKTSNLCSKKQ